MNIRIAFSYLFFLLSVVFCAVQLVTLFPAQEPEWARQALEFCSALVCLVLASLAVRSGHRNALIIISLIAFTVCFLAVLGSGILAMKGTAVGTPIKYIIFLAYAGLYGFFGSAFSLVATKCAKTEAGKES